MEMVDGTVSLGRFVLAFAFVICLILLIGAIAKRSGWERKLLGQGRSGARLGIEEVLAIDARTKLVLVRRDGTRHLLLLGQNNATLIESDIPAVTESVPHA